MRNRVVTGVLCLVCAVLALGQQVPNRVRIHGVAAGKSPVSLAGVKTDGSVEAALFLKVLKADLDRSGWVQVTDSPNASFRVEGMAGGGGGVAANLRIVGGAAGVVPWSRRAGSSEVRQAAHNASDEIVKALTGNPGMASAPMLLVGKRGGKMDVYQCDADGGRLQGLTGEGVNCLSPTWLPDRSGFVYTSFAKRYAAVYMMKRRPEGGYKRTILANYPGLNNGGIVSPDGNYVAMVLSFSGNVELYLQNLHTKKLIRLTRTPHANEASPDWAPDGQTLAYVSDEGGSPQVYVLASQGARKGRRLIHGLQESVSPDWSPDGKKIAFCGKMRGVYGIYVAGMDGQHALISPQDGNSYQDPSWAPDGRHLVATRGRDGNRTLVLLDSMGDPPVNLTPYPGEWYLADWAK